MADSLSHGANLTNLPVLHPTNFSSPGFGTVTSTSDREEQAHEEEQQEQQEAIGKFQQLCPNPFVTSHPIHTNM